MQEKFSREMGFTREEFFKLLPAAINGRRYQLDDSGVTIEAPPGTARIDVGVQQQRKIASISLPYVTVEFEFKDLSSGEVVEFMRYFDLRYQRGGG